MKQTATEEELLRERIGTTLSGSPDACAGVTVALVQRLAAALIPIIGDEGFDTLLCRTAHRVAHAYPWFRIDPTILPTNLELAAMRGCFDGQAPGQAHAASMLLFSSFIDVLASLIGAHLTTLILNSALGGAGHDQQQGAE